MTTTTGHALGTCPACGFVLAAATIGDRTTCPNCSTHVQLDWVLGEHSDQPCDDRCMFATRPRCECSCGGENHGAGYLNVNYVPAWVRARDTRRHTEKQARRQAKQEAARAAADRHREMLLDTYPLLEILLGDDYADADPFTFIGEMRDKLRRTGTLTEAQATAACNAIERGLARAEQDRREQELRQAGVKVPTGKTTVTGTVATVRDQKFQGRTTWKMLLVTEPGWKVWLAVPKDARLAYEEARRASYGSDMNLRSWLTGKTLTVETTLTPSGDDPLFGFGARPKLVTGPALDPAAEL